jgi:Flp pilus assembly protein CpaB
VAGNIRPGSYVDIYGTFDTTRTAGTTGPKTGSTVKTVLMLSNVPVLATDNRTTATQFSLATRRQGAVYSTVTVAVTPEEAMLLVYAQSNGKLTLTLRNAMDVLPGPQLPDVDGTNLFKRVEQAKDIRRKLADEKAAVPE